MSVRKFAATRVACRMASAVMVFAVVAACASSAFAQSFTQQRSVGGVKFGPDGMLARATQAETAQLRREILQRMDEVPGALNEQAELRTISLAKIDAAMRHSQQTGEELPEAIRYLGGLQHVDYLLVYPEEHDIVLVGPAEGWEIDDGGNLVGVSTGRSVLLLDDLMTALRAVNDPNPCVFSCSIDPTAEGLAQLASFSRTLRPGADPQLVAARFEQLLGPQEISTTGVPGTSHFARVMVAADYRMKQIGMGLEAAPVAGLPSYLQMVRGSRGSSSLTPRWWLEPEYDALVGDADGHCWKLPNGTVKAMTENDFFDASGEKRKTGKADVVSQRWADMLTERYEALSQADPVFAQLKDCIDLSIVATLIVRKDLMGEAGVELPMLMEKQPTVEFPAPTGVASKAAILRKTGRVMIACGGVQINPWDIVEAAETSARVASIRDKVTLDETNWWSN